VVSWAADYHACKTKHAYLSGWVAGKVAKPEPVPEPKKKRWWVF
jgi:hypothetical protein